MHSLFILKLGGSIVTAKREEKAIIKKEEIAHFATEIKRAREKKYFNLILIHGAGSFGHDLARKYKLWEGIKTKSQILAFAKTQTQTILLNQVILEIFTACGLPTITINPSAIIIQENKKIFYFDTKIIEHFLEIGFIPVLYGTVVPDKRISGSVCSGDTILGYLAKKLKPKMAIFATDVDGIFTKDPNRFKEAKLITEITNRNYKDVIKGTEGSASKIDVGGGMRGKLEEIYKFAKGIEIWIVNGERKTSLRRLLTYQNVIGTRILFN